MKAPLAWSLALTLAAATAVSGCATTGGFAGTNNAANYSCTKTAVLGAVLGALLGGTKNSKTALEGAAVGAAVSGLACLAIKAHARQTRSARIVEAAYQRTHGGLPAVPKVVDYRTSIQPSRPVSAGQAINVRSSFDVVDGTQQHVSSLREEMLLLGTDGKPVNRAVKDVQASGGGYQTTFSFALPKGVSQGVYGIRTALLVNGKVAARSSGGVQLVVTHDAQLNRIAVR